MASPMHQECVIPTHKKEEKIISSKLQSSLFPSLPCSFCSQGVSPMKPL